MINKMSTSISFICLLLFLTGCGTATTHVDSKQGKGDQEKIDEMAEDQNISVPELDLTEVQATVEKLIEGINEVYINAGQKYKLVEKPLSEKVYQAMARDLNTLATDKLIDTKLYDIAKEYCYGGCDATYFPRPTSTGLRLKLTDHKNGQITLTYVVPENDIVGSSKESVTLEYDGQDWKIDSFHSTLMDKLNLTKNEAGSLLQASGYKIVQFVEEKDGAYVFELKDGDKICVGKGTGYITQYMEEKTAATSKRMATSEVDRSSKKDSYLQKMAELEAELAWVDDKYDEYSVVDMQDLEEMRYDEWDKMLNDIYGTLEEVLPTDEMEALRVKQREWVANRDPDAEQGTDQLGGGWQYLQYLINLVYMTKDRCYELVENYL